MSAYKLDDERTIRAGRHAHDWKKSGLLSAEQYERIKPELHVDLRRTNVFLRVVLFIFAMLIFQSALGILAITVAISGESGAAVMCAGAGVLAFWLAGYLVDRFKLYRFGIEEAAAVMAIGLMGGAAGLGVAAMRQDGLGVGAMSQDGAAIVAAGLISAAAVALAVFLRFGYLYAAIAAAACVSGLPFVFDGSEIIQRMVSITTLAAIAAAAWMKRTEYGDEHPGDSYGFIEAVAWIGIYVVIILQMFTTIDRTAWSYWPTYAAMWVLPVLGLWLSIRTRHRMLLHASVLMLLATLMSNKAYLGTPRYAWDPIVFGLLLMGSAIGIKRWLASGENGERHGFTATRILASDRAKIGLVGMAALAHQPAGAAEPASAPADPVGGGGRSGGAGASGSF